MGSAYKKGHKITENSERSERIFFLRVKGRLTVLKGSNSRISLDFPLKQGQIGYFPLKIEHCLAHFYEKSNICEIKIRRNYLLFKAGLKRLCLVFFKLKQVGQHGRVISQLKVHLLK